MEICEFISNNVAETESYAERFAANLVGGEVLLLEGDLGAGKTHFVKGLARGLGIDEMITSPTFALHNSYEGKFTLNHFDFYRISDSEEVEILGLHEFFYDKNAVCAIEWSQNIKNLLPKNCITITIEKIDENKRKIILA